MSNETIIIRVHKKYAHGRVLGIVPVECPDAHAEFTTPWPLEAIQNFRIDQTVRILIEDLGRKVVVKFLAIELLTDGGAPLQKPYVSIDIETTGTEPDWCQIIEFGAVIDDHLSPVDNLKHFHAYVYHDKIVGQPFALQMNAAILLKLAKAEKAIRDKSSVEFEGDLFVRPKALGKLFKGFLDGAGVQGAPVAAGKNFASFDRQFLLRLEQFDVAFHHRTMDPAMLFWEPGDDVPPGSEECKKRAGIPGAVAHTAIADALDVIRMIRVARERRTPRREATPYFPSQSIRGM